MPLASLPRQSRQGLSEPDSSSVQLGAKAGLEWSKARYAPTFESGHGSSLALPSVSRGAPKRGAPDVRDLSRALRLIKHREVDKKTERCADKARVGAGSGFRCGETYPETRICYPTLLG